MSKAPTSSSNKPVLDKLSFGLLPCDNLSFTIKSNDAYEAHIHGSPDTYTGKISPVSPITIGEAYRKAEKIPAEADSFVWAYPFDNAYPKGNDEAPETKFAKYGGYIYFKGDKVLRIIAVNDVPGSDIQFEGPYPFQDSDKIAELEKHGRFQPVTLPFLREKQISKFCWLVPYEKCSEGKVLSSLGSFLYLHPQGSFYFSAKNKA